MKSGVLDHAAVGEAARKIGIRSIFHTSDDDKAAREAEAKKHPSIGGCEYCQKHQMTCSGACWEC